VCVSRSTCLASSLAAALCASSSTFLRSATGVTTGGSPWGVSVGEPADSAAEAAAARVGWEGEGTAGRMVGAAVEGSAAVAAATAAATRTTAEAPPPPLAAAYADA